MPRQPNPKQVAAWSAAGGALFVAGLSTAVLLALQPASTHVPPVAITAAAALTAVGLYVLLGPLLRFPPWRVRESDAPIRTMRASTSLPVPRALPALRVSDEELRRISASRDPRFAGYRRIDKEPGSALRGSDASPRPKTNFEGSVLSLKDWLEQRIAEAERHLRERVVLGDSANRKAMGTWDFDNTHYLSQQHPSLVQQYRGEPPGHLPGASHEDAYYERQVAWFRATLDRLRHETATDGQLSETVTRSSIERELAPFVALAGRLLRKGVVREQVDAWASSVGIGIRARGPIGEEEMFLAEGHGLAPADELRAKVARLQNHILPKVRAGEWLRSHSPS